MVESSRGNFKGSIRMVLYESTFLSVRLAFSRKIREGVLTRALDRIAASTLQRQLRYRISSESAHLAILLLLAGSTWSTCQSSRWQRLERRIFPFLSGKVPQVGAREELSNHAGAGITAHGSRTGLVGGLSSKLRRFGYYLAQDSRLVDSVPFV